MSAWRASEVCAGVLVRTIVPLVLAPNVFVTAKLTPLQHTYEHKSGQLAGATEVSAILLHCSIQCTQPAEC